MPLGNNLHNNRLADETARMKKKRDFGSSEVWMSGTELHFTF